MSENIEQNIENKCTLPEVSSVKPSGFLDVYAIKSFEIIMVFCSLMLSVIIAAAAFTRYVIGGDLYGYEDWVKLFAFWVYFMGGAYGAYNDTHVSADLVNSYLSGKTRKIMIFIRQVMTSILSIAFACLGYYFFFYGLFGAIPKNVLTIDWDGAKLSYDFVNIWNQRAIARTTVWQIPLWTSYAAIFIGLIFMAIYFTRRCIRTGIALIKDGIALIKGGK